MRIRMGVVFLALLMWAAPASAQKTYSVSVSHHSDVPLTEDEVRKILADASKLLQKEPGYKNTAEDVACNVGYALQGPVRTFTSPDKVAFGDMDVDALHRIDANVPTDLHVKVVEKIMLCRDTPGMFRGCAYPPKYRSIIVVRPSKQVDSPGEFAEHIVWAHELGHLMGLGHTKNKQSLMRCGGVTETSVRVSQRECNCMRKGPGSCKLPAAPLWC
jgi:Matrixin